MASVRVTFRQPPPGGMARAVNELVEVLDDDGWVVADLSDRVTNITIRNEVANPRVLVLELLGPVVESETVEQ